MNAVKKKTAEVETKEVIRKNITLTEITFRHSGLEAKANDGWLNKTKKHVSPDYALQKKVRSHDSFTELGS